VKRLFFFVVKAAFLIALAVWLADRPGTAHIVWHEYEIETSAAFLAVVIAAAGFVLYLLFRLWYLIIHGSEIWRLKRSLNKLQRGQEQLTEGLIAIASGNAAEAGRYAVGARKLLGVTAATRLLQAQAAQLAGDRTAAREIFLALAAEPQSAVLGYRGLIMTALREKNWDEAERLTEKLRRLKPETPWLNLILFDLAVRRHEWDIAETALAHVTAARLAAPERTRQSQAALLAARADEDARLGRTEEALQAAERAVRLAPNWLPAAIILAERQMESGHKRAASHTIERGWKIAPHPQLAAIYRLGPSADPLQAYKQIERLCRDNIEAPASRYALAEAALAADLWGEARHQLLALVGHNEATQNAYRLLAKLEQREGGGETAAAQWLTRAIDAPADPVWLCRACGGAHEKWQALCTHCGAFDTLDWQVPGQSRGGNVDPAVNLLTSWID
jgi:HemY protein